MASFTATRGPSPPGSSSRRIHVDTARRVGLRSRQAEQRHRCDPDARSAEPPKGGDQEYCEAARRSSGHDEPECAERGAAKRGDQQHRSPFLSQALRSVQTMVIVIAIAVGLVVAVVCGLAVARSAKSQLERLHVEQSAALATHLAGEREHTVTAAADMAARLAGERLGDHLASGSRQLDLRAEAFEQRVGALGEQLVRMGDLVAGLQRERAEQHGQLVTGLAEATRESRRLAETTQHLREALASPKARGQWGERMADDVLRLAGMVEGITYRKQTAIPGGTIPDVTFLLPGGRQLHMDVKFPIDNYLRYLEAATDAERDRAAAAFLRDVRNRIKELASRGYVQPEATLDEVLLFIPNESVYAFIHEHDPELIDVALRQKVVLCSPVTLFAVLAVVRQAVEHARLERTSDELLECLGGFSQEWVKFSGSLDTVVKRFDTAQRGLEDLTGPRLRQLERQLGRIDDLRARRGLPEPADAHGDGEGEVLRRAVGDIRELPGTA
jgi:DNA recombination protein RmuC